MTDKKKVVFCIPTVTRPYKQTLDSMAASIPLLDVAGIDHYLVTTVGNPYISAARSQMLRKALDIKADIIIFVDHDVSWRPEDLLKLINTDGDVVAGLYRFKEDTEHYMGVYDDDDGALKIREDGAIKAAKVPAGFLKITANAVNRFMTIHPELCYGQKFNLSVDLFNHGAIDNLWYGEDYAFCKRWTELGGDIWIVPDMDINHHSVDKVFEGNVHQFLMKQPGGSNFKE